MNYLTAAWAALVRLVRPDVDAIISAFVKAQKKLEGYIERELATLEAEAKEAEDLWQNCIARMNKLGASKSRRNTAIDRAYSVIHKLDELVA